MMVVNQEVTIMINEFGKRLYSARKMAGLSMAALAEKSGAVVSKQAIGKYEKGLINPASDVLIALASALGVKVDYFFRPSTISIEGLEFRKKVKMTRKIENQIKYQTINFIQKYLELEGILNTQTPFENPVTRPLVKNRQDIETAAKEIRDKWELGVRRSKITLWELKKLKGIFGISIQAIMARAANLSIISPNTYKSFCIYARKNGLHREEPGEYKGKEVANRFKQLVYHGLQNRRSASARQLSF